ncbi:MAG TPA: AtpZ/AtpI family protein [Tepidisphaeraceae bacterium]|nr:AtpZ/AtpI family protein [Tepidisphaeraceae bacterium]
MPDEQKNSSDDKHRSEKSDERRPDEKALRQKYGLEKSESISLQTVSTAGLELGFIVFAMVMGGWALDKWLKTEPVFVLLGVAIGIGGGMYRFIRRFMKVS